jgi:hypothetical protein
MRIYYKPDGIIYKVLKAINIFFYDDVYGKALPFIDIEEDEFVSGRQSLCQDLLKTHTLIDANGENKYKIELKDGKFIPVEKPGWIEIQES